MKKILYLITKTDVGGAQKYVSDLAAHIDKNTFTVKVLYGEKDVRWLSNRTYPWFFFVNDWFAVFELVRIFRRERPDVIHLNSSKAGVIGSFAAGIYKLINASTHQLKTVFTAHGWVFNPTNSISPLARMCYVLLHRFAALFEDCIVNVSEYDRRLALEYRIAPQGKLVTIYNGIDPNLPFLKKEEARKEIMNRLYPKPYTLDPHLPWIGSLGRFTPEKNYELFVRVASELTEAYFFIIGDGACQNAIERMISRTGLTNRFFIIPPKGADYKLLKAFDLFAMTSIKEGLPYALLEAVSAGIPIVATRVGGIPEVLHENKKSVLVPRRDIQAFQKGIQTLLNQKNADQPLEKRFMLETMIENTAACYVLPTLDRAQ